MYVYNVSFNNNLHFTLLIILYCSLKVKIKRNYPLTSIEAVEYKEKEDPTNFRLIFSTYIMILQAETADEAKDWVECINNGEYAMHTI